MKKKRPINLALTTLTFPPMAIASILHRLSGLLLFILIPVLLYALQLSLKSPESFLMVKSSLNGLLVRFFVWLFLAGLIYHFIAGLRHMIMDLGFGESLKAAKITALSVIFGSLLLVVYVGVKLW